MSQAVRWSNALLVMCDDLLERRLHVVTLPEEHSRLRLVILLQGYNRGAQRGHLLA